MKFNWGTGIVLAFIGFISFILFFVIQMSTDKKYEHDLVTDDYYKQELEYQGEINKEENAKNLIQNLNWNKTAEGLAIEFPGDLDFKNITGKMFLYRPSNEKFDCEFPITLSNHTLLIPEKSLLDGRWNIKVDWQYNQEKYLYKKEITY